MNNIHSFRDTIGKEYIKPNTRDLVIFRNGLIDKTAQDFYKLEKNLTDETIKHFFLGYDVYRNYATIPDIKNGEVVNVAYRTLDKDKKEKYIKQKGCENWIFNENGLEEAKKKGGILITSNQFDAMSAWQVGLKNVVSVPVGKDAVGDWIELFDSIPKIYIAFENTKVSKRYALTLAERLGTDKCFEVQIPEDSKDLNAYFKKYTQEDFRVLVKDAKPYYKYQFNGLKEVIDTLREKIENYLVLDCMPKFLEIEENWTIVLSGDSNIGKTSISMNIANELSSKGIPTIIFPIERGVKSAAKRFLQVRYNKTKNEIRDLPDSEWEKIIPDVVDLPIYFAMPNADEVETTIQRAKKFFNVKFVIVDHLDLLVRNTDSRNVNADTAKTVQHFVRLGQEHNVIFLLIHHINKPAFSPVKAKKPKKEDLKGTSTLYQDPEAVILISQPDGDIKKIEIDVVKNKGEMGSRIYEFNVGTGVIGKDVTDGYRTPSQQALDEF